MSNQGNEQTNRIFTIPNILTMFRIGLIPVFMYLYLSGHFVPALIVIGLSALSDVLDGFIARKFHLVTTLGKVLDPIADKLSQLALMLCLLKQFWPQMLIPVIIIVVKELTTGIVGLVMVNKTGVVRSSVWHGKVTTVLLYAMIMLHVVWPGIPTTLSWITVLVCSVMMLISFVLYVIRYAKIIREGRSAESETEPEEAEGSPDPGPEQKTEP